MFLLLRGYHNNNIGKGITLILSHQISGKTVGTQMSENRKRPKETFFCHKLLNLVLADTVVDTALNDFHQVANHIIRLFI